METAVTIETIYQVLTELKEIMENNESDEQSAMYLGDIKESTEQILTDLEYTEISVDDEGIQTSRQVSYLEKIDNSLQDINLTLKYGFAFALVIAVVAMLVKTFFTGW